MKRRTFLKYAVSVPAASLAGTVGGKAVSLDEDVKFGFSSPANLDNNGVYVWLHACAEVLESQGFGVRMYPNSSLGGEMERLYQTQLGLMEMTVTSGDSIGRWSPMTYAGARPFLIKTYEHMDRLLTQTPYLDIISAELAPYGLKIIDFIYTGSMVGLFTRGKAVRRLEDLRKLRLRVLSAADMDLLRAWNVRGVQVAWEEVAQALQTGMVDAYLNPPNIAPMFGHGAVLDYFTDLRMGPAFRLLLASTKWLTRLTRTEYSAFEKAATAGRKANRLWTRKVIKRDRERLEQSGIQWISLTDDERAEWIDACAKIPPNRWEIPAKTALYNKWVAETAETSS
ncbi:TRAP transporter substrate-binding protein [Luteithermobacter gelatinilyticus]|uniref:TRAP transporter substrate-binding protein n=1 Tax=Luteithermobacter gelatinilyticus TaxID=2582913 RepID=UPI0011069111|nr:TRAP transporter substrate-binding protein [Luteithermobacter gelatinilyticus]